MKTKEEAQNTVKTLEKTTTGNRYMLCTMLIMNSFCLKSQTQAQAIQAPNLTRIFGNHQSVCKRIKKTLLFVLLLELFTFWREFAVPEILE